MQTVAWKQAQKKQRIYPLGAQKALKTGSQNQQKSAKINKNLSCQKTEGTIVLELLQSTGKSRVATKEEQKMRPKWSWGRACGAASTTQRTP